MWNLQRLPALLMSGFHPTFSTYIAKLVYILVLMHRYLLTMAAVRRLYGGCMVEVPRKSHYAVRASWYLHRVSSTNCKLKVLLYHHREVQLHIYCSSTVLGILNLVIVSLNLVRLVLFEGEVNWWKLGFQPDNHIINDITITTAVNQWCILLNLVDLQLYLVCTIVLEYGRTRVLVLGL